VPIRALLEVNVARLVCRLGNDGRQDVDIVGINDGDLLTEFEALILMLKAVTSQLDAIAQQLDHLR
jgi:hypothetical protein